MDSKPAAVAPVVRRTAAAAPAASRIAPATSLPQAPQDPDGDAPEVPADSAEVLQGGPMSAYVKPLQDLAAKVTAQGERYLPFLHHPDVAQAHQRVVDAATLLASAAATLLSTPFDPKAKAAKAGLYAGARVQLVARSVSHYAGLFNSQSRWTVISTHGSRLLVEGDEGRQIFFALKEVEIAQDANTAQA